MKTSSEVIPQVSNSGIDDQEDCSENQPVGVTSSTAKARYLTGFPSANWFNCDNPSRKLQEGFTSFWQNINFVTAVKSQQRGADCQHNEARLLDKVTTEMWKQIPKYSDFNITFYKMTFKWT